MGSALLGYSGTSSTHGITLVSVIYGILDKLLYHINFNIMSSRIGLLREPLESNNIIMNEFKNRLIKRAFGE